MDEPWLEETLIPSEESATQTVKFIRDQGRSAAEAQEELRTTSECVLRIDRPRWIEVDARTLMKSGHVGRFLLIRLGFQFDLAVTAREKGARFSYARCSAYLWPEQEGQPQPTVLDVIPRDLYEGEPRRVTLKLAPSISFGETVKASVGEVSTDVIVGTVEP